MTVQIRVYDEDAKGEKVNSVALKFERDQASIVEIVRTRVGQEVRKFNLMRPVNFTMLIRPKGAVETDNGYRLQEHRDLDVDKYCDLAEAAFRERRFFLMVDGKERQDPDEVIALKPGTEISFYRVVPIDAV